MRNIWSFPTAQDFAKVEEDFGTGKFVKYQICLWDLIEKPHTSFAAKVFIVVVTVFVVVVFVIVVFLIVVVVIIIIASIGTE